MFFAAVPATAAPDVGRQHSVQQLDDADDREGVLLAGLDHHGVAHGERGGELAAVWMGGQLNGMISPTTPTGSW
jgi:hypothetical protein